MTDVWFLFLMIGLKAPILGIGYFIYRVLKAQDDAWENGGYGIDPGTDEGGGGGGGGGPRLSPSPKPRGGPMRRRLERRRRPLPVIRPHELGSPLRRPAPLRTRLRPGSPVRTRPHV